MIVKIILKFSLLAILVSGCSGAVNSGQFVNPTPLHPEAGREFGKSHIEAFSESVRPIDGETKAKYDLARHFQRIGNHRIAIQALEEILRIFTGHADAYNAMGFSYDCIGDHVVAQKYYRMAIDLNSEMDYAYNNLGYSYLLTGEYAQAVNCLNKAIAQNNTIQKYHKNLAYAYFKAGDKAMAEQALNRLEDPSAGERIREWLGLASKDIQNSLPLPTDNAVPDDPTYLPMLVTLTDPDDPTYLPFIGPTPQTSVFDHQDSGRHVDSMSFLITHPRFQLQIKVAAAIEVSNGNGVRRMAESIGDYLHDYGLRVERLTNADHFGHAETIIYYRDGYFDAATQIKKLLPGLPHIGHLVASHQEREPIRILIGRDLVHFAPIANKHVDVDITNGNGVNGMGERLWQYLHSEGFRVGRLTNADHFGYAHTIVFYGKGESAHANLVAKALPGGGPCRLVELDRAGQRVQVLMGSDLIPGFDSSMQADFRFDLRTIPGRNT